MKKSRWTGERSDEAYHEAVAEVIDAVLGTSYGLADVKDSLYARLLGDLGSPSPEMVGQIYEFLRGFTPILNDQGEPDLVASDHSKRNQGLFYTPPAVVRHIVSCCIDALGVPEVAQYLDLKVLDPAVGTGLFLLEAMDQLTGRVLGADGKREGACKRRVEEIRQAAEARARKSGNSAPVDEATAVRLHLLETNLYGVDVDAVAVNVARAALLNRTFGKFAIIPGVAPNIRVGNALVGEGAVPGRRRASAEADRRHAGLYLGKKDLPSDLVNQVRDAKKMLHWSLEYPHIFGASQWGFDAVVGNPPYEIVSAKESGIDDRRRDQDYFRKMFQTCQGKINTFRLMMERGLNLLRPGGVLGFVVPATVLADSSAGKLRRMLLDESEVIDAVVVPEKARIFPGVTQALAIIVTRKGGISKTVKPRVWSGFDSISAARGIEVSRDFIENSGLRIPVFRSSEEKRMFQALLGRPTFGGDRHLPAIGQVHQGEINLTVHRAFIKAVPGGNPLIRGEHVYQFRVIHPAARGGRLDWLDKLAFDRHLAARRSQQEKKLQTSGASRRARGKPWETDRIVLGRVVNMGTRKRLKAATVAAGSFLGDMTNFISDLTVSTNYLLGLLNSALLNWRIKLTSTNNYLSAGEIEALPILRPPQAEFGYSGIEINKAMQSILENRPCSIRSALNYLDEFLSGQSQNHLEAFLASAVEVCVDLITTEPETWESDQPVKDNLINLLDALVLKLYGLEQFASVLEL